MPITSASRVRRSRSQVSTTLQDEEIVLELEKGTYFGLRGTAVRVWQLMAEPVTVDAIRQTLLDEFDVDRERCEADLDALLQTLEDHRLIEVDDG